MESLPVYITWGEERGASEVSEEVVGEKGGGGERRLTISGYAVLLMNVTTPRVSPGRSRVSQHSYQSLCPTNQK